MGEMKKGLKMEISGNLKIYQMIEAGNTFTPWFPLLPWFQYQ